VASAKLEFIFENQGSSWNFVDCSLILGKGRGLFEKLAGIIGLELFSNGKKAWTRSIAHGPWLWTVHHGPRTGP
jgi:hypothetical protein